MLRTKISVYLLLYFETETMRKILFLFYMVLSVTLFSQPTLNYATHAPTSGDLSSFSGVEFTYPGESGRNVVWDFSGVIPNGKTTFSQQSTASDEDAAKFEFTPSIILDENGNQFFHSLDQTSYSMTGFINSDFEIYYHKPFTRMVYPFAYSNSFEGQLIATSLNVNSGKTEINGNYSFVADAYGEIILPGNVRKKVLRVYQKSLSVQQTVCYEINVESHKYTWYSVDERYPIATTVIQNNRYSNGKVENLSSTWINNKYLNFENIADSDQFEETSDNEAALSVFPNPFKENAEISVFLNKDLEISLAVYSAAGIKVLDICKPTFYKKGIYTFELNEDNTSLKPGLYFVKLQTETKTVVQKLIRNQ